jgi:hypothetical protein
VIPGRRLSAGKISAAIYLLAATVRLTLAFGFGRYEIGRPEPVNIAISLARTGAFANPHSFPTGATAHLAPIHPALLAPIYAIWGDTPTADRIRIGLSALAASAEYALLPYVAGALGLGMWPGVFAGLGGALIPLHYWPECMGEFEATDAALFLALSTIFFARFLRRPSFAAGPALRAGLWWGFGLLLAPQVLPVLAGFLAIGAWKLRPGRPALRWMCLFAAAVLAVLAPWTIRNYVRLDGVFFVRDNVGLELYTSNHDRASASAAQTAAQPRHGTVHPHGSAEAARELVRVGEVAYYGALRDKALAWIRGHPRQFLRLTLARIRTFWFPDPPRFREAYWVTTLAAFLGLVLLFRENRLAAAILASVLVTFSAAYALIENHLRYQHPVYWILLLLIGWAAWVPLRRPLPRSELQDPDRAV